MTIQRMISAGVTSLLLWGVAAAEKPAAPQLQVTFRIEAQSLEDALNEFGRQAGYQLMFQSAVVVKHTAPKVDGSLTPEEALKALLANTGLKRGGPEISDSFPRSDKWSPAV